MISCLIATYGHSSSILMLIILAYIFNHDAYIYIYIYIYINSYMYLFMNNAFSFVSCIVTLILLYC